MIYVRFVIKQIVHGTWRYLPNRAIGENFDDHSEAWPEDPYPANKFATYDEADKYLKTAVLEQHWGGIFQIEKMFISK